MRHHQNGRTLTMEGHTPGGEARHPPIGGRRSHTLHGGCASTHGVQRSISPQVLTKESRPPSSRRHCTVSLFLGLTNTCCNRNGRGGAGRSSLPGGTMRKLTSRGFRKCGTFGVYDFLKGSYWLSKSSKISKKKMGRRRCQKKRTATILIFRA